MDWLNTMQIQAACVSVALGVDEYNLQMVPNTTRTMLVFNRPWKKKLKDQLLESTTAFSPIET